MPDRSHPSGAPPDRRSPSLPPPVPPLHFPPPVALCRRQLTRSWAVRAGWILVGGVVLVYGAAMLWSLLRGHPLSLAGRIAWTTNGLGWLTWLGGGLTAWGCARNTQAVAEAEGLLTLVQLRGRSTGSLSLAWTIATIETVSWATVVPGVLLGLLGLVRISSSAAWLPELGLGVGAVTYSSLVGLLLGLAARIAPVLSPDHPRRAFLGLVGVPELARWLFPGMVSIPSLLKLALDTVPAFGGGWPG